MSATMHPGRFLRYVRHVQFPYLELRPTRTRAITSSPFLRDLPYLCVPLHLVF